MKEEKPALTLYHDWDSLMSFKVRACLAEKQLPWQSQRVVLRNFEHLQPDYLRLNPNGVVPTLVHQQRVIIESSVINEYLDDAFPANPLRPVAAEDKAKMRQWCKYFDDEIHPALRPLTFELMIRQRFQKMQKTQLEQLVQAHPMPQRAQAFRKLVGTDTDMAAVFNAIDRVRKIIRNVAQRVSHTPWLAGPDYSLADTASMALVDRLQRLQLDCLWQEVPETTDWLRRLLARPAFKLVQPATDLRMPSPKPEIMTRVRQGLLTSAYQTD
ncbi:glutathione S-transferase family protein [Lacimicrobium sp. SS2-24]|uniref:glutathione S-transferase family protein n=1 Tax=Lacimicrobium sp. SS2-24 TaxID=2005569 RepID=UPI001439AC94|nr:glutathione S-transferase family protein [Lacimicrobium sp. SS2-24]